MIKKEVITKFYYNYRLYIFPAVVALSSLFLIVFAIFPQTMKLVSNQQLSSDLQNKSKFLENKVAALESYDAEDLLHKVELVLTSYPSDKDFGNVLGLLQQQTSEFGLSVVSASLGGGSGKSGDTESYEVKLEVVGSRSLFSAFLNNLENLSRLIRVKGVDISSGQASAISASLVVEVLYSKLPQTFGAIDSPIPELNQKDEELLASLAATTETMATSSAAPPSQRGKLNPFE